MHKVSGRPSLRAVVWLSPLLRAVVQFVVCSSRLLKNVTKSPLRAQGEWSPLAVVWLSPLLRAVVQLCLLI